MLTKKKGPIYLQIKDKIKERILKGVYPINSNLPTELEFEEEFQVSKITVRKALEVLSQEGYLERQSGKGTKVISNQAFSKLSKGQTFTDTLIEHGHDLGKVVLGFQSIKLDKDDKLFKLFGMNCYEITRYFVLDGEPFIYFRHYIPGWIHIPEQTVKENHSIYSVIRNNQIVFDHFVDEFDIAIPDEKIREILQIEEKPLLRRVRYSYDDENRCVEYAEAFYDTSVHRYMLKFNV